MTRPSTAPDAISAARVPGTRPPAWLAARLGASALLLGLLAACATPPAQLADENSDAPQRAAEYVAHARGHYTPPGPPEDPWAPYIKEAAQRFDVPEQWVRSVMRVESGGHEYRGGSLITSNAGAMGLMQVMPRTYDELRERYALGSDPFDPHDNIVAGVAYMRELYDIYGSPGFLAAYNGGPARLDDYLGNFRPLPDETRHYVAMIAPAIEGIWPKTRSPAEAFAMNEMPVDIPAGYRNGRVMLAAARHSTPAHAHAQVAGRHAVRVARAERTTQRGHRAEPVELAMALPADPPVHMAKGRGGHDGFHLIPTAQAAEAEPSHTGAGWAVQVGAFSSERDARHAVGKAAASAHVSAREKVASVRDGRAVLYRARLTGLSHGAAVHACQKLSKSHGHCMVISPDSQS